MIHLLQCFYSIKKFSHESQNFTPTIIAEHQKKRQLKVNEEKKA